MERRQLGTLSVSVVGLGCNNFGGRLDQDQTTAVVDAALDAGVNFFDTADIYGNQQSEVLLGRALGARRRDAVIATKFGMPMSDTDYGASPAYIRRAVTASLARLDTDYIDLYQLHYPDDTVPVAETLGALGELVAEGLVREVGCSNLTAAQLRDAAAVKSPVHFVSLQNQYSLLWREPETSGTLAACEELHVGLLPYYPLANGWLTGGQDPDGPRVAGSRLSTMDENRSAYWNNDELLLTRVRSLRAYAQESATPLLTLAFSWLASRPRVTSVIAGASSPEQVRANAAAVGPLDAAVVAILDQCTS